MKKNIFNLSFFLLLSILLVQKSIGQNNINGHWCAYPIIEKVDKTTISFSDFFSSYLSDDKRTLRLEKLEIFFDNGIMDIIIDAKSKRTKYKYDIDKEMISFIFNNKEYKFKLLNIIGNINQYLILKDTNGALILLEKKNNN